MIDTAKIEKIDGIQYVPAGEDKVPYFKEWQITPRDYDFTDRRAKIIGVVCGGLSGGVEVIDIDCKYDLSGDLIKRYGELIRQMAPDLMGKLVIQKTRNKGYHFIYRTTVVETSKKLAMRHGNEAEIEKGDKVKVLIETRGNLSYFACYPSQGYKFLQGTLANIQMISEEERQVLFDAAFTFNEVVTEYKVPKVSVRKQTMGLRPSEDFNERGDVISLLEEHGWKVSGRSGHRILLKRPGDSKTRSSGHFDQSDRRFSVFSTSTIFETNTRYQPWAVYAVLKANCDWKLASKMLFDEGFGTEEVKLTEGDVPSIIDTSDDDDYSFFATREDYDKYLHSWRNKTFEMGKSTGIPELDEHFLFKEGNLVIVNGIDNVGKSSLVWYLAMLSALQHDWNWIIFSSENRVGGVIRKLAEFYWCEPIDQMTETKYKIAVEFVENHFSIVKSQERMFNYKDLLNIAKKGLRQKTYKGLMIDPYNSLKVDIPKSSKQQIYDYHYEAASVIQLFAKQNNISIYLNCHVGTVGARNKDKGGYTKAPQKEDTEGGVMFANKADEFLTIHRITQHETDWKYTELHVRKVKETETGGRVTYFHRPIDFTMVNDCSGFISVPNRKTFSGGTNAVLAFHERNRQQPIPVQPTEAEVINNSMDKPKENLKLPF